MEIRSLQFAALLGVAGHAGAQDWPARPSR